MIRIVTVAWLACLAGGAAAATGDADASWRVTTVGPFVPGAAGEPSVVAHADGFVVTWQARLDDGVTALRFAVLDADGKTQRTGEIARGSGWFVNWADFPSLAIADNGDWVAHWLQRRGAGYAYDIHVVRSRDGGANWGTPVLMHDDGTRSEHGFVSLAPTGGDGIVAAWLDGRETVSSRASGHDHGDDHAHGAGRMTLRSARSTRDGVVDGVQLDASVCDCCQTDAVRVDGDLLVVYRGRSDGEIRDVHVVRYAEGRWQQPQPLFADAWKIEGCPVNGPAIAARGRHVIAAAYTEAGGTPKVRVRTSSDGGRRWHPATTIADGGTLGRLDAAALPDERFAIARLDVAQGDARLIVSIHDARGATVGDVELARLPAQRLSGFPRMAASGERLLIAWTDPSDGTPQVRAALLHSVVVTR